MIEIKMFEENEPYNKKTQTPISDVKLITYNIFFFYIFMVCKLSIYTEIV